MSTKPVVSEGIPVRADSGSNGQRNSIHLGPRDRLKGTLYVEGDLLVTGTVDGELEATGDVEIDGGGRVSGPVIARNRLVVGSSGSLIGDVRVAKLVVRDGASMLGNVSMVKPGDPISAAPAVIAVPAAVEPEVHAAGNGNGAEAKANGAEAIAPKAAANGDAPPAEKPSAPAKPARDHDVMEVLRNRAKQNQRKRGRRR